MNNVPLVSCRGWALVSIKEPWCAPSYVRMTREGVWSSFQDNFGQGAINPSELQKMGYRVIEVLISPIEPFIRSEI